VEGHKIIAISGGSASGKTTIASLIAEKLGEERAMVLCSDSYYKDLSSLSVEERKEVNFDHPDAFDSEYFFKHVKILKSGEKILKPQYDFSTHTRAEKKEEISTKSFTIVEGLFALVFDEINNLYDLKIFVDAEDGTRLERRINRDVKERGRTRESVVNQYEKTVRPMYEMFIEPRKKCADIIIEWNEHDEGVIDEIIEKIKKIPL